MLTVEQIMKRHDLAQRRKDNWRQIYEDCYEFALPQRNLYDGYYEGGDIKKDECLFLPSKQPGPTEGSFDVTP